MSLASRTSTLVAAVVGAAALLVIDVTGVAPGASAAATSAPASGAAVVRHGDAHVLAKAPPLHRQQGTDDEVVATTDQGITMVMWTLFDGNRTRLEWAIARPGKPWTRTQVKAVWHGIAGLKHGLPQLTASSNHRITAAWLDARRSVVVADWSPVHGWAQPVRVSNPRHHAWKPQLISNQRGQVAVSWAQQASDFTHPVAAMVAVRRAAAWQVTRVGPQLFAGLPMALQIGIADDGAVTAAWGNARDIHHTENLARQLPAGTTSWEPIHDLGPSTCTLDDECLPGVVTLGVQPDGTALLGTGDTTFIRALNGEWTDVGAHPWMFGIDQTTPTGAMVSWVPGNGFCCEVPPTRDVVFIDPDGLAGPASFAGIGTPSTLGEPFATSDDELVTVAGRGHHVLMSTWTKASGWSDAQVVYTDRHRWINGPSPTFEDTDPVDMTPDGHVTALIRTRPANRPNHPLDLEVIRFDATP